jgi:hypothetical protein
VLITLATLVTSLAEAQPEVAARCVAASERAQTKRDEGQLLASRAEFVACAEEACPAIVRRECARWLADVDERIPSIIVSVKDSAGKDVASGSSDVITLDGARSGDAVNAGRAIKVDPGPHVIVVATPHNGQSIEERVVVREREKGRVVTLSFQRKGDDGSGGGGGGGVPMKRTIPTLSWVLGGVAIAGGATFGVLWAKGMDEVSNLRSTCAPFCSNDQIDSVTPTLTGARIALGVGIAAAALAVVVYFVQPTTLAPAKRAAAGSASSPLWIAF